MTTSFLALDVAGDEGFRGVAYPDVRSPLGRELAKPAAKRVAGWRKLSGAPWTYGYGATHRPDGQPVQPGDTIGAADAKALLAANLAAAEATLDRGLAWWRQLNDPRQDVLAQMLFNLGWPTFAGFKDFLSLVDAARFPEAADDLLASKVAAELPKRYGRLAEQMRTGVR